MSEDRFKAMLVYLQMTIESELQGRTTVAPGQLDKAVSEHGGMFKLSPLEHERAVKHLETIFGTRQDDGHLLRGDFAEWYPKEKASIEFHYWRRLEKYWKDRSILPVDVIRSVDQVTDEIMGFLGNPKDRTGWNRRRGLVMGHVQMGKTTNYSALVSKAADAGYRIIIILAGITNSLRYQTQVRLDQTFVGKSSISDAAHSKIYDVARSFAGQEGYVARHPFCGTSQLSDFNASTANTTGAHEGNFADPILFVTKKNPKVLERLADWLRGLRHDEKLDGPMLLIDDEADNASVNTSTDPDRATIINQRIRSLLHTCKQSTYVGYTATPFANIFIDPDTTDDWDREDLFPADFIKSLDPPDNYVGSQRLFGDKGDLASSCVREIPADYVGLLPVAHKAGWRVSALPASLVDAIREYVLARALRIAKGDGARHSAMLVNVSRFNAVQSQIRDLIESELADLRSSIETWAMASWEKSPALLQLKRVWDAEYADIAGMTWDEIRPHLNPSISSISSLLVNMRGGTIEYERAPSTGLHVIGVGGLALARGLTLEGLLVSYVLRNVGAADTLLQMGRWFGYRPGFENLCRIHVTPGLVGDFREVSESVEELRADFRRMALLGKKPFEFGLKVRQSPTGIAITAKNKMRSAAPLSLAEDFSTRHLQAYAIYPADAVNRANRAAIDTFVAGLPPTAAVPQTEDRSNALVWSGVPVATILGLLRKMDLPQTEFNALEIDGTSSLVGAYIEDRATGELKDWDVAIPFVRRKAGSTSHLVPFPYSASAGDGDLLCRSRASAVPDGKLVKISAKNAVAFGVDDLMLGEADRQALKARAEVIRIEAEAAGDEAPSEGTRLAMSRTRPLLLVHLLQLSPASDSGLELSFDPKQPVVTISIVFPETSMACRARKYYASPRLIQLLAEIREQAEADEDADDE